MFLCFIRHPASLRRPLAPVNAPTLLNLWTARLQFSPFPLCLFGVSAFRRIYGSELVSVCSSSCLHQALYSARCWSFFLFSSSYSDIYNHVYVTLHHLPSKIAYLSWFSPTSQTETSIKQINWGREVWKLCFSLRESNQFQLIFNFQVFCSWGWFFLY